jgi:hypothetical protein
MNVKLSLIGWFESASANGHRAYIEVRSWQKPLIITLKQISPIPQYMGLKSLRYHYWCPFNHEREGISSPRSNLSYFLGTTDRGAPRMHCNTKDGVNIRDWTRFPDPLWRGHSLFFIRSSKETRPPLHTHECWGQLREYFTKSSHRYITPDLCLATSWPHDLIYIFYIYLKLYWNACHSSNEIWKWC